jgi:hypothetical protein
MELGHVASSRESRQRVICGSGSAREVEVDRTPGHALIWGYRIEVKLGSSLSRGMSGNENVDRGDNYMR